MAMSSQRLLILLISINVIISICMGVITNPDIYNSDQTNQYTDLLKEYGNDLNSEGEVQSPESQDQEGTYGSAGSMGKLVFGLLISGLDPFPFNGLTGSDNVLTLLMTVLQFFRGLIFILIIIEGYMIIKNSKTS